MKFRAAREELDQIRGSFRIIFGNRPDNPKIIWLFKLINSIVDALDSPHPEKMMSCTQSTPDAIDLINEAADMLLDNQLDQLIFERFNHIPHDRFFLEHAARAATMPEVIHRLAEMFESFSIPHGVSRIRPEWLAKIPPSPVKADMSENELNSAIAEHDPFGAGRTLKYLNSSFVPVRPQNWRRMEDFYGFHSVRDIFKEHFNSFAAGNPAPPLFITSLPGLGKTAMTIAATLGNPELTLIIAEPKALEESLEQMFQTLGSYPHRRFVVFFDDIDPREVNWYSFRTCVGGTFAQPDNINIVIAANYDFSPNVLSRGRKITFPIFDEISCQEMISDFLVRHKLRNPSHNLISVMAADYVEEFGQKKFAELSPRSLIRYLEIYMRDPKKRKKMLEASYQELIMRPDAQLFYEQNIKMMRALYGDGYIEDILREKLRKLGGGE